MHPMLALLGTSLLSASSVYRGGIAGMVAFALGSAALILSRRDRLPVLKRVPGVVDPGSLQATVLSVVLLLIGLGASALAVNPEFSTVHPLAATGATVVAGLAFFGFDAKDLAGIKSPPSGPIGPAAFVLLALFCSCAWLQHHGGRALECSGRAVADHVAELLPAVKKCLGSGSVDACLSALVEPAKGITIDVVACIVHGEVSKVSGPGDVEAGKRSEAGRDWLRRNGFTFAGE